MNWSETIHFQHRSQAWANPPEELCVEQFQRKMGYSNPNSHLLYRFSILQKHWSPALNYKVMIRNHPRSFKESTRVVFFCQKIDQEIPIRHVNNFDKALLLPFFLKIIFQGFEIDILAHNFNNKSLLPWLGPMVPFFTSIRAPSSDYFGRRSCCNMFKSFSTEASPFLEEVSWIFWAATSPKRFNSFSL